MPNHCSIEHPWFQAALKAGPGSPERNRFHFKDRPADGSPPNNWQSMFGWPAWTRLDDGQWYLHMWDSSQPEFNWRDPAVPALFEDTLRFWLDRAAAGVRVDVALGLHKAEGLPDLLPRVAPVSPGAPYIAQPELFETYRSWRKILDSYPADVFPGRRAAVTPWEAADLRAAIDFSLEVCAGSQTRTPWVLENHDFPRLATRLGVDQELVRNPTEEVMRGEVDVDVELGAHRARAVLAPRRCCCWRCRARPISTRARSSACSKSSTSPPTAARIPCSPEQPG